MGTLFNRAFRFLIVATVALSAMTAVAEEPRGLRTNNPGNIIKTSIKWVGEEEECTDPVNECFESSYYGIRAMAIILNNYYDRHNLRTIDAVIKRWGPAGEDAEEVRRNYISLVSNSYIKHACESPIKEVYVHLIRAIIHFENGSNPFSEDFVRRVVYDTIRTDNHAWECPDWRYAQVMGDEGTQSDGGTTAYAESLGHTGEAREEREGIFKSKLSMDPTIPSNSYSFRSFSVAQVGTLVRTGSNSWVDRIPAGLLVHGRKGGGPMEIPLRGRYNAARYSRFGGGIRTVFRKQYCGA